MNRFVLLLGLLMPVAGWAQPAEKNKPKSDTMEYKRWTIIVQRDGKDGTPDTIRINNRSKENKKKSKSPGGGIDIGWSNYIDNTNYTRAIAQGDVALGMGSDDLKLSLGRSWNVNLWLVMDEVPLIKKAVQLQYGFGLELNNYSFDSRNTYLAKNPMYVYKGTESYKKGKLAADYLSVPLMIKFNLTPNRTNNPFTIAGGISGGFLYSARFKTKANGDVSKIRDDFELNRFKLSYVGELGLGPIKLYGSYATRNMFRNELNFTPYTVGFRFVD